MAVTLRFGPADLLRCRFAVSPMLETLSAIRLLSPREGVGPHGRWLDTRDTRDLDLRPIALLQPRRGYTPDFLSPPPAGPLARFEDELAAVAATDHERVRAELRRSLADTPGAADSAAGRRLLGPPAEVLPMLVSLVRRAWEVLVEPVWPQVRGLLERDVAFQSRRLAEGGLDRLFAELHPRLRWHNGVLTREYGDHEHRELRGEGLALVPSVFKWDQVVVVVDPPWQPTVIYPARGLGTLWQPRSPGRHAALGRLLGRTRAALLTGLDEPASTTVLAHRHALAAGTVSEHLSVLRDAGFVAGDRHRHEVRYRRTPLGDAAVGQPARR
ncbi:ArsR/SmtB family transcription factor [Plantactinospora siamensis]|uniref:ArsR/SmtB family transcription factor n=1 Tax=Plantactinospora siamensis TaxID=555372 RepID=A0ABV6P1X7_9ACTN